MTTVTQTDHDRMNWHQRQWLNNRLRADNNQLRAETIELRAIAATLRETIDERMAALNVDAEANFAAAKTILEQLPADPLAARHRVALDQDLAHRSGDWR